MPHPLPSTLLVVLVLQLVTGQSAEPPASKTAPNKPREAKQHDPEIVRLQREAATKQEKLRREFDEFTHALLRLAQRFEHGRTENDRATARILRRALSMCGEQDFTVRLARLADMLRIKEAFSNLEHITYARQRSEQLTKDLHNLATLLLTADPDA